MQATIMSGWKGFLMSKFKSYDDLRIKVVQSTKHPREIIALACNLTQKQSIEINISEITAVKLVEYLFKANHTSPFEHCYITFLLENISRSFLAQITRHRIGSFTSASQHYQKYDSYPNVLDPRMVSMDAVVKFLDKADDLFGLRVGHKSTLQPGRLHGPDRIVEHVAAAQQFLSSRSVQNNARVYLGGHGKSNARSNSRCRCHTK